MGKQFNYTLKMCTFNDSGLDNNSVFSEMGFATEDIKINKAKSELELIKNILKNSFCDASDVVAESSKAVDNLSSSISKAEELTSGFYEQVQEIQSVLNGFCLRRDGGTIGTGETHHRYKCTECDDTFPYPNLLDIHMKLHKKRYACDICGKKYQKLTFLDKHKLYGHKKTYDCRYCTRVFATYQSLRVHENLEHENPRKSKSIKNGCPNCELDFGSPEDLEKHLKVCAKVYVRASYSAGPSPAYQPIISPALSVRSLPNISKLTPIDNVASPGIGKLPSSPQITLTKMDTTCPFCSREPFAATTSRDRHIKRFHPNMIHFLTNTNFHNTKSSWAKEPKLEHVCTYCGRSFSELKKLHYHEAGHRKNEDDSQMDLGQEFIF
ncbi:Zinc finger, C2H2 domain and Zinc finger C2H2-type/integrase DNA-binding domain and Zinc finger, C2H2-like domain-containing protein [Strongyloides ratti]|uniref:Zinc finger, C2H2 domain and Zinc finger C2H2-type/integrase DNA-binding domain and Zinc finger, C2H2-like domain-containing protein n=1 Tax=Strongyloides ratti TaxID=34506 RepID=A0A090MX76_STRRB|nr:Zinc finger, C2H2 domain and Zinc finger C2H2-type/integrase DNA-binding domain and Zinc finger, C2H2-like domain-containing protein [Strongyloides ratti]CEF64949.1 Zinc finger, C2H2 domain and Zinc finger C2H2-type/integrase DNA-binding domain and Zinc finger, C2H2-like domain-containing protein [Strongyloides ratti]